MARNTSHSRHPSNARKRREIHIARSTELRERKRLRRARAKIHRAMEAAQALVEASKRDAAVESYSYRATDKKTDRGWPIERNDNSTYGYAASRDKARKLAKDLNADPEMMQAEGITRDEAMLQLGYERVVGNRPVEQKFVRA